MNPQTLNNWGPAAVIVVGYVITYYLQQKKLNNLINTIKFDTVNVEFKALKDRLSEIEKQLKQSTIITKG